MSNFHLGAKAFIDKLDINDSIILEIGSERGEGSTAWFDAVAKDLNKEFYSVDVTDHASTTLAHLKNTNLIVTSAGSVWTKDNLNKKISVLYLDNYDWISTMNNIRPVEQELINEYDSRGVNMSNFDCQREHLEQMINCMPYMDEQSIVICDDTPFDKSSGVYFGKNGPVIPYLVIHGYKVYRFENGVILTRGM
jgi:hypothetical protein|tara:strand:+ start:9480 stop:10061 length:582 start_codon:yes stop_codon:yes gene_type:complete